MLSSFLPNPKTSNWLCTSFQAISTLFASENQTSQLQEPTQPRQSPVNSTLKTCPRRKLWALLLRICLNCNHSATSTLRAAIAQQAQWQLYGQLSGPAACLQSLANATPAAAFQQRYKLTIPKCPMPESAHGYRLVFFTDPHVFCMLSG